MAAGRAKENEAVALDVKLATQTGRLVDYEVSVKAAAAAEAASRQRCERCQSCVGQYRRVKNKINIFFSYNETYRYMQSMKLTTHSP